MILTLVTNEKPIKCRIF